MIVCSSYTGWQCFAGITSFERGRGGSRWAIARDHAHRAHQPQGYRPRGGYRHRSDVQDDLPARARRPGYQLGDHLRLSLADNTGTSGRTAAPAHARGPGLGQQRYGDGAYIYQFTEKGGGRAQKALTKSGYVGPAPVPFEEYAASFFTVNSQSQGRRDSAHVQFGRSCDQPANAGGSWAGPELTSSIFFYGAPETGRHQSRRASCGCWADRSLSLTPLTSRARSWSFSIRCAHCRSLRRAAV